MDYKAHIGVGVVFTLFCLIVIKMFFGDIAYLDNPLDFGLASFAIIYGAVILDVDSLASKANQYLTLFGMIFILLLLFLGRQGYAIFLLCALIAIWAFRFAGTLSHRGITHTALGISFLSIPWLYIGPLCFIGACSSMISHIISDKISTWWKRK